MKPVVWGVLLPVSTHYRLRVHTYLAESGLVQMRGMASRSAQKAAAAAAEMGMPRSYGILRGAPCGQGDRGRLHSASQPPPRGMDQEMRGRR